MASRTFAFVPPATSDLFDEFTIRELSSDPICITKALICKNFLRRDALSTISSHNGKEAQAICLVDAVTNEIKKAPVKFSEFLEVLSEQFWSKHIADHLNSIHQYQFSDCTGKWHAKIISGEF